MRVQSFSRPQQHNQQAAVQLMPLAVVLNLLGVQRLRLLLLVRRHPRSNRSQDSSSHSRSSSSMNFQLMSKPLQRRVKMHRQHTALRLQMVQQQNAQEEQQPMQQQLLRLQQSLMMMQLLLLDQRMTAAVVKQQLRRLLW
jgi:ABC-type anion transport system duplicated permease subunit